MTVKTFALIAGLLYLAAGALGFVPGMLTPAAAHAPALSITEFSGDLLGVFPVNFMLNLAHLAIGAWGLAASRAVAGARAYAKSLVVILGALAVAGLIPAVQTVFGLMPLYGADVWLHGATALAAAFFGWVLKGSAAVSPTAA